MTERKKIAVGITGASGSVLAVRLLEELRAAQAEIHLIWSDMGQKTLKIETGRDPEAVDTLADFRYREDNMTALIASGSFFLDAMVIMPCSMRTLAAVACGYSNNLITRTADVMLKERRRLVLGVRETPFSSIHLRNMLTLSDCGAMIMPPCMGFYTKPETKEELIDQYIAKVLDAMRVRHNLRCRWEGAPA